MEVREFRDTTLLPKLLIDLTGVMIDDGSKHQIGLNGLKHL